MPRISILRTAILIFFCVFSIKGISQTGTITGKVYDTESGLVGATIFLESSKAQGANSDINGNFSISRVPVGNQTVVITYLGYDPKSIEVEVKEGEVSEINVELVAISLQSDEVVISAQRRGQTQAINQQLASDMIANVVSSDRIQELPDVNAAEAIGRLPGVALSRSGGEGQKVIIRGLEPKFSAITINGVRLPSNSSTDRSVDLSLISPELLDAIEVFKSPLPNMDAEAIGGTVNLRLRKAPDKLRLKTKGLWGYNNLAKQFKDYKGVIQVSNRFFKKRLGVIAQTSVERFNRSGDFLSNVWREGRTDSLNNTEILGSSLRIEDRQETRKRVNGSLSLDYEINKKHNLSLFSLYSQTNIDRFSLTERYNPSDPSIIHTGEGLENILSLASVSLSGDHNFGIVLIDWTVASSQSKGQRPYNYYLSFSDTKNDFDDALNQNAHPKNYFDAASPDLAETNLVGGEFTNSSTTENSSTALINATIPLKLAKGIQLDIKFGGKYYQIDRERDYEVLSEDFYYLGGTYTANSAALYQGPLNYLPTNNSLIGISSFFSSNSAPVFRNEQGQEVTLNSNLDPTIIKNWYESQKEILNNNRFALVNRYQVNESITAGYGMLKLKVGDKITIIPGFRYEYSDNAYSAGLSTVNGRYGVNGTFDDTTTFQKYGELLPHLHIKIKPLSWFDIRASYAQTLARPDFSFVTPRAQINHTNLEINAGNPTLKYAKSTNYDIHLSAYKGVLGLLSVGAFYKKMEDVFFPWEIRLTDDETAAANGWPDLKGYSLSSYSNLAPSTVFGYEVDLQTHLGFLPKPFDGFVLNVNYSRLYSQTEVFFQTSETILVNPFPPIFETIYTTHKRDAALVSQTPHIFHLSVGYDYKKFSARFSGIYQGIRVTRYSINKDFDRFTLDFWRWDASIKQGIGDHWNIFLNLNNITNQQDISFTRNEKYLNTIQTFGMTGTIGLQYNL